MANFSSSLSHSLWVIVYQSAIRKYQLKVCLWSDSNPWPFEDCYPSRQNTCSIVKLSLITPKIRPRWTSNFISRKWKKSLKVRKFFWSCDSASEILRKFWATYAGASAGILKYRNKQVQFEQVPWHLAKVEFYILDYFVFHQIVAFR